MLRIPFDAEFDFLIDENVHKPFPCILALVSARNLCKSVQKTKKNKIFYDFFEKPKAQKNRGWQGPFSKASAGQERGPARRNAPGGYGNNDDDDAVKAQR